MTIKTVLAALVLTVLTLPFALPAEAIGLAPRNGVTYNCGSGSFESITFHVNGTGTLRRGTCELKQSGRVDTKKCDIAWKNNSNYWEFTLVREAQCKDTVVFRDHRGNEFILFRRCQGVANTTCVARY